MVLDGFRGGVGEHVRAAFQGGDARLAFHPFEGRAGGVEDAAHGRGDFGTDAIPGDEYSGVFLHRS